MSVGGEVQLCTPKAWVFQPILPNLTFASVQQAFTPCTLSHNLRPFRSISINRRRDADFGRICCSGAPRPPSRSEAKPVAHPTTINLTASLVVSVTLHASGGCRSKFLRRALTRNCLAALIAGLTQRTPCESSAMPLAGLTQRTSCRAHAMRLAELPVKLCPSPTPFPLPSKAWQSPSGGLWEETGVRPGTGAIGPRTEAFRPGTRAIGRKNPAFGLENRSRLSQRTGRARIGGHPRQNRRTSRT